MTTPLTTLDKVREFHTLYEQPIRTNRSLRVPEKDLRLKLIVEEVNELDTAIKNRDFVEIADALGDIEYVIQGAVLTFGLNLSNSAYTIEDASKTLSEEVAYLADALDREDISATERSLSILSDTVYLMAASVGIDLDKVIDIIHRSNLTKLGDDGKPIYNEFRKVIKGPNYVPPTEGIRRYLDSVGVGVNG